MKLKVLRRMSVDEKRLGSEERYEDVHDDRSHQVGHEAEFARHWSSFFELGLLPVRNSNS